MFYIEILKQINNLFISLLLNFCFAVKYKLFFFYLFPARSILVYFLTLSNNKLS